MHIYVRIRQHARVNHSVGTGPWSLLSENLTSDSLPCVARVRDNNSIGCALPARLCTAAESHWCPQRSLTQLLCRKSQ